MKNLCYLILLSFITIATQSCKDKQNQTFEPSLDLEEYVLLNFDGVERLYTTDNFITVSHYYQGELEEPYITISLTPQENTYTHFFLEMKNPAVTDFETEQLRFNFLDYSIDESYPMISASCTNYACEGNIELTIHEYGVIGEKLIGEFSGTLSGFNDPGNTNQSFEGEFVVFIDQ
ncbi:MAG: hypothetical protein ACI94Y_000975 [Maribacter sp.]|jgi:hypothetical protein